MVEQRDLSRVLRTHLWPRLSGIGFADRTDRVAWRRHDGHVDVVEIATVGERADPIGCTPVSFTAHVASVPAWLMVPHIRLRQGLPAPHYWNTPLRRSLEKSLHQPWFRPFTRAPGNLPGPLALHRAGLMRVLRRDTHDRPDIWYVLDDGSNLDEAALDLLQVIESDGLPQLEAYHDPHTVIRLARSGELPMTPNSPAAEELVAAAERAIATGSV